MNEVSQISFYVDGADETNADFHLIKVFSFSMRVFPNKKGGGGALTREKIVAAASEKFICLFMLPFAFLTTRHLRQEQICF